MYTGNRILEYFINKLHKHFGLSALWIVLALFIAPILKKVYDPLVNSQHTKLSNNLVYFSPDFSISWLSVSCFQILMLAGLIKENQEVQYAHA